MTQETTAVIPFTGFYESIHAQGIDGLINEIDDEGVSTSVITTHSKTVTQKST